MVDDAPPTSPGWHRHPEYTTVERYWDGERWTGEHRFAAQASDPVRETAAREGELARSDAQLVAGVCFLVAAVSSGLSLAHDSPALLVGMHLPLVALGMFSRSAGLSMAVILATTAAYGFVDGFAVGFVAARTCTGWFCFSPGEIGLVAGVVIAQTSLLAAVVGWFLGWLLNR